MKVRSRFPAPQGREDAASDPPTDLFDDLVKSVLTHRHAAGCPEIARDERDDAERQIRSLLRAFDEVTDAAPPGLSADELTARVQARCPDVSLPFWVVEEIDCDGEPVGHHITIGYRSDPDTR
jgi:hypothetical protein